MKKIALLFLVMIFSFIFSGCAKEPNCPKMKLPKLKTCVVKKRSIKYEVKNGKICLSRANYKLLKKQNYRLRVCNSLLNAQNRDFNSKFYSKNENSKKEF